MAPRHWVDENFGIFDLGIESYLEHIIILAQKSVVQIRPKGVKLLVNTWTDKNGAASQAIKPKFLCGFPL